MRSRSIAILLLLFTGLNIFLTLNYHSHSERYSYHGELWADRGGYFMYLPYTFAFGFNVDRIPDGLDTLTGHGFHVDRAHGRAITKYTAGVALLQAPIYLATHAVAWVLGMDRTPYGTVDHLVVDLAGPIFLSLGLLLLFNLLRRRHGDQVSAWTLLGVYAGSNLYYYTIGDPGMSHVYSFFLFAFLLYTLDRWHDRPDDRLSLVLIGLAAGWIVLIRPTNLVFVALAPMVGAIDLVDARRRYLQLLSTRHLAYLLIPACLIWVPQMLYWHHAFGSALTWPYVEEGFSNWASPQLASFWFAPNNGLFTYTPMYLLALVAAWTGWRMGAKATGLATWVAFAMVSYLGASWWVWHFGCGFGSRIMVEYLALFALPIAAWTDHAMKRWGLWLPVTVFVLLAAYNLKLVHSYGNCWFHDEWDWQAFGQLLFGPTK